MAAWFVASVLALATVALVPPSTGDGPAGWRVDAEAVALALQLKARCTLRTRPYLHHGDSTTPPLSPAEPLLLQPDASTPWPPGLSAWRDRRVFVRRHGNLLVEPRSGIEVAAGGARRRARNGEDAGTHQVRLLSVLADGHRHQATSQDHRRVVFERAKLADQTVQVGQECGDDDGDGADVGGGGGSDVGGASASWLDRGGAAMADDLGWIATLGDNAHAGSSNVEFDSLVLSVAPVGHGLPRHSHGASWFALVVGTKVLERERGREREREGESAREHAALRWRGARARLPALPTQLEAALFAAHLHVVAGELILLLVLCFVAVAALSRCAVLSAQFWLIAPPGEAGTAWAADPRPARHFLEQLVANRSAVLPGLQWCVQEAGEIVSLPAFYHHATVNLGEAVGIGGQANAFSWASPLQATAVLSDRIAQDPRNPRLLEALADAMERSGAKAGALRHLLRAVDEEPLNQRLALKTARVAIDLGQRRLVGHACSKPGPICRCYPAGS